MVWNLHVYLARADVAAGLSVFDYSTDSWGLGRMVRVIENMNINDSRQIFTILSLRLRISKISHFLTPHSGDELVLFLIVK